jgi:hypothetical protein
MPWFRAVLCLAATGALLGSALDAIHTHTGTTEYADPWVLRMAWWTPLLFAAGAVALGLAGAALAGRRPPPSAARVAAEMALFIAAYFASGLVPNGLARSAVLTAIFAATWACDRTARGFGFALVVAAGGAALEITLIRAGAFRHLAPEIYGLPYWLPWLYATAAIAVGDWGRRLVRA